MYCDMTPYHRYGDILGKSHLIFSLLLSMFSDSTYILKLRIHMYFCNSAALKHVENLGEEILTGIVPENQAI